MRSRDVFGGLYLGADFVALLRIRDQSVLAPRQMASVAALHFKAFLLLSVLSGFAHAQTMSEAARDYLNEVLDVMQENSVRQNFIDWEAFRADAVPKAGDAQTPRELYPLIWELMTELGDNHSYFIEADLGPRRKGRTGDRDIVHQPAPERYITSEDIGVAVLPGHIGKGDLGGSRDYAVVVQTHIRELYERGACGFIVDLRENYGGNMWPMLAGLAPLFDDGPVGAFVSPDGERSVWAFKNGQITLAGQSLHKVARTYKLPKALPVAVLTSRRTISSGEAVTISFIGRPNTRSFGKPTYGLPTANRSFALSDGARLVLTTAYEEDRNGQRYDGPIMPDKRSGDTDVMGDATTWLLRQSACLKRKLSF